MIKKKYFKIKRKFLNFLVKNHSGLYRPSSYPFISGDTFRKYSDHIYDETKKLNPKNVKENDLVFINGDYISDFFKNVHPGINNNYKLISHNSDFNITEKELNFIDDKIIHWFAQNLGVCQNDKISPIPIGLENLRYQNNGILSHFDLNGENVKTKYILCSLNASTNFDERSHVIKISKNIKNIEVLNFPNHSLYSSSLQKYRFNLCPSGNGLDTHRIWESLMIKTIPILKESLFSENLKNLGFPILLVKSWNELNEFSKSDLDKYYSNLSKDDNFQDVMFFEYWKKKIINS